MTFYFPNFKIPPPDFMIPSTDEKIQQFLKNRTQPSTQLWTISKFQLALRRIEELKTQILENNRKEDVKELTDILDSIDKPDVITAIRRKIDQRKKKRAWLKKRKQKIKEEVEQSKLARQAKHTQIDMKLKQAREEAVKEKQIQDGKRETEKSLSDIKKRIIRTEKQLKHFDSLVEIRRLRKSQSSREDTNILFESDINELKESWQELLVELRQELEQLEDYLLQKFNRKQFLEDQWDQALFGEKLSVKIDHPLLKAERSVEEFFEVRKGWDICLHNEGSSIPIFWVTPNETPNTDWAQYLKEN